jgi:uncharacterized protein YrzB (UPF0473 family)
MADERDDVVVLVDENGEEVEFEHLDTIEQNGKEYVILLPKTAEEGTDEDVDEVVILKIEHNENGEDSFVTVEDEGELQGVFEEFKTRMEDQYDFGDE